MQRHNSTVPTEVLINLIVNCGGNTPTSSIYGLEQDLVPRWEVGVDHALVSAEKGEEWVSIVLEKPLLRNEGDLEDHKTFKLDSEGLTVLMVHALAGAQLEVVAAGKRPKIYHYLGLRLPGEEPIDVQRLLANAPSNVYSLVNVDDHRDLRRSRLGQEHEHRGKRVFRTRADIIRVTKRHMSNTGLELLLGRNRYEEMLTNSYELLDLIPLVTTNPNS